MLSDSSVSWSSQQPQHMPPYCSLSSLAMKTYQEYRLTLGKNKGYTPIFATADRKLYEQKDELYNLTGVIVEDPLYAVGTYRSIMQKP